MSREEAHKILDKLIDFGYCGQVVFPLFKKTVGAAKLVDQTIKSADELMMVTIGA